MQDSGCIKEPQSRTAAWGHLQAEQLQTPISCAGQSAGPTRQGLQVDKLIACCSWSCWCSCLHPCYHPACVSSKHIAEGCWLFGVLSQQSAFAKGHHADAKEELAMSGKRQPWCTEGTSAPCKHCPVSERHTRTSPLSPAVANRTASLSSATAALRLPFALWAVAVAGITTTPARLAACHEVLYSSSKETRSVTCPCTGLLTFQCLIYGHHCQLCMRAQVPQHHDAVTAP